MVHCLVIFLILTPPAILGPRSISVLLALVGVTPSGKIVPYSLLRLEPVTPLKSEHESSAPSENKSVSPLTTKQTEIFLFYQYFLST